MKLVIDLIVGLLWVLIKIGDTVILASEFAGKNARQAFKNPKKTKFELPRLTLPELKIPEIKVNLNLPKLTLNLSTPVKQANSLLSVLRSSVPKRKKRIKVERPKDVTIFPGSIPNLFKLKYFLFGAFFSLILVYVPLLILIFLQNLPNPRLLSLRDVAQTTKIYDRNGTLLYQIYAAQNRTVVPLSSIPKNLINATIAIEDKDFYKNPGFDIGGIARATIANLQGKPLQGGSTITQQLVKSTLLTPEKTLTRKIKEIILAFWAERIYTKEEILTMYFNQVSYGGTSWGVEAAAHTYFGKDVKDVSLGESAFLAGLTRAPTTYYPYGENPTLWKERQKEVLGRMRQLKFISGQEQEEAQVEEFVFVPKESPIRTPHFVFYVKDWLIKKYGLAMVEKGGLSVITSLDLKLQEKVQNIVKNEVEQDARFNLSNGAALVTNPKNGDILAMVGSKDYDEPLFGKVNITTSLRQPGSSVKPITYSVALSQNFTAATIINDSKTSFGGQGGPIYTPVNYDGKFRGNVSLRIALANSINVPAVKTLATIGVKSMVDQAKRMGVTTWENPQNYGLAVTLGAAEVKMTDMAQVYGTLANLGEKVDLDPILKVKDSTGNTIFEKNNPSKVRVLDAGVAYIISNILSDNGARAMEFGTNSPLNIPGVSAKTGTSDRLRDNWTFGFTPDFVVAAWVGNNDNTPMNGIASGITGAAPIWRSIFLELLAKRVPVKLAKPDNIIEKNCIGRKELFIVGTEKLVNCSFVTPKPSASPIQQARQ